MHSILVSIVACGTTHSQHMEGMLHWSERSSCPLRQACLKGTMASLRDQSARTFQHIAALSKRGLTRLMSPMRRLRHLTGRSLDVSSFPRHALVVVWCKST